MRNLRPEIAYENAINDLKRKYSELKQLTATIMYRRDELAADVKKQQTELVALETALTRAVDENRDIDAQALLQQKHVSEGRIAAAADDLAQAQTDVEAAKESLIEVKNGIERLKAERPRAVGQKAASDLAELDGFSVDAELVALENAREHIKNTIAMVDLNRELSAKAATNSPTQKAEDLEVKARAQLEELKRLRGQQSSDKKL